MVNLAITGLMLGYYLQQNFVALSKAVMITLVGIKASTYGALKNASFAFTLLEYLGFQFRQILQLNPAAHLLAS